MQKRLTIKQHAAGWLGVLLAAKAHAKANPWQMNMHEGVTPLSHDMYYLHMVAMSVCALIGVVVFGVMIFSLIHHRKSKGHVPSQFRENLRLELFWTLIPFLILIALAVPATHVLIRMDDTDKADVTIKIVGHQWKWQYQYLDQGIQFFSNLATPYDQVANQQPKSQWYLLEVDKPLVLPVHKKIRFLVTSHDVVHSWWVPELGVKRDAMPGFMHESWARIEKPGVYRGQCAELCGINHGFMPIVVHAVNEADFQTWVKQQTTVQDIYAKEEKAPKAQPTLTRQALMSQGKAKYEQICSACHQVNGKGLPPMFPALQGSSIAVGHPIERHIQLILNGVPGSAMQAFKDQLTDEEIAAVVTYERNAWGNNTNDMVQPADVAKARKEGQQAPTMVNKAKAGGLR